MKFTSYYLDSPIQKGRVFDVFEPYTGTEKKDFAVFLVHLVNETSSRGNCFRIKSSRTYGGNSFQRGFVF